MRKRKSIRPVSSAQVLEDRALLAATLAEGVLTIEGTDDADVIKIRLEEADVVEDDDDPVMPEQEADAETDEPAVDMIVVMDNGERSEFPAADVQSIVVSTGDGDDKIRMSRNLEVSAEVDAGAGDDKVKTAGGDDTVIGGEGDDKIKTGGGADSVDGGEGDDKIVGGNGDDTLAGGDGDDKVKGGRGDDFVDGGEGNDRLSAGGGNNDVDGGAGDDSLRGNSANDTLIGGEGENVIRDKADRITTMVDKFFERFDENEDGLLNEDELGNRLTQITEGMDADEDGSISRDELTTAINEKISDRKDRVSERRSNRRSGRRR